MKGQPGNKAHISIALREKKHLIPILLSAMISFLVLWSSCTGPVINKKSDQPGKSTSPTQASSDHITQGVYESCAPYQGAYCLSRLRHIAEAGFSLVVNYDQLYGNAQQQLLYAKQAQAAGLKIIWTLNDPAFWDGEDLIGKYRDLAATCKGCYDNTDFIRYFIYLVKNLPATWGYYIGDEVKPGDYNKMKISADLVKQLDPFHPRLFITGVSSTKGVRTLLTPFVDTAEFVGVDYYPVGSNNMSITATGDIAKEVQLIADQHGKQPVMVMQAFSWAQYPNEEWRCTPFPDCARFPSKEEILQMCNLVVINSHIPIILWYSYFDILKSNNPTGHWYDLVNAALKEPSSCAHT